MDDTHHRWPVVLRSPMLRRCSTHGCTVIVFGGGTCVEHDPPRTVAERLLAEARARAAASTPAADASPRRVEGAADGPRTL